MLTRSSIGLGVVWLMLGLGAAVGTAVALPTTSFRASALVAITEATSPVASILSRTAAEVAVSKPVMMRAAESLIGTGFPAPEPDLAERAAVAAHLAGAKATGKNARLAADLPRLVTARPGETPGSLEIVASTADAERSIQVASAVADALMADQDEAIAKAHRKRDLESAARLDRLKAAAAAARRRLVTLGGVESDPVQALAAAAAQTTRAQARVDSIRAIIASGSPPLSDRRDVPATIDTLQASYLDLARQLAKARETLGERHSTIIALHAELRHSTASLTAEWRRLGRMAEAELATARERQASLQKSESGPGAAQHEAIEEARRNVQVADDHVARALAVTHDATADERGYRLLLRPTMPSSPAGFAPVTRALLGGLAGLLVLGIGLLTGRTRAGRPRFAPVVVPAADAARPQGAIMVDLEAEAPDDVPFAAPQVQRARTAHDRPRARLGMHSSTEGEPEAMDAGEELVQTMTDLVPRLESLDPGFGPVPTVMVASNETIADTSRVALALGRAAAGGGYRVLLIEATRARSNLAGAAAPDADPLLVDFFGTLRVAMRVSAHDGMLFLAPNLHQGAHIASALARDGETPLVDDIGAEFDLVVIDGGCVAEAVAAGWGADTHLRVGRFRSKRDDDQFASALGVEGEAILGSVVASTFSEAPVASWRSTSPSGASSPRSPQTAPLLSNVVSSSRSRQASRRRVSAR